MGKLRVREFFMLRYLDAHFEQILGSILLAIMATIAFINVIVRYCTSFSFAWTEEITVNFFVWITLLGTAWAFRTGQHLAMNIFYQALPRGGKTVCNVCGLLICLIFFGALVYTGTLEVLDEYELESISESLGIPVWWYTIATPLFSLLVIFRIFQHAWQTWQTGKF